MGAVRSLCAAAIAVACGGGDPAVGPIVWTDVTVEAGLPFETYSCVVFDDLDGDGRVDLLLGPGLPGLEDLGRVTAYAGREGGRFARFPIPQATGQAVMSCDAADVTGDGFVDLFLGHVGGSVSYLRGVAAFAWEDASSELPPLAADPDTRAVSSLRTFDLDDDGWLDLFVGLTSITIADACAESAGDYICVGFEQTWLATRLYRNTGGAGFEEVAGGLGETTALAAHSAGPLDWDGDGRLDLLVSHDYGATALYRNVDGAGTFEDLAPALGFGIHSHGMGTSAADFDGDGARDVYLADLGPDQFWFRVAADRWEDRAPALGIAEWTRHHSGWSPVAGDFDRDGRLDLFVVNSALLFRAEDLETVARGGSVPPSRQADYLYRQRAGGWELEIVDHTDGAPAEVGGGSAAVADYDGDGDLDLAEHYGPNHFRLLRNDTPGGHWLVVRAGGPVAAALDARVEVWADGRSMGRRWIGESGATARSWKAAHFGLGDADRAERVTVTWRDGREVMLMDVSADQAITVEPP